jgi:Cft2 family RNA processing exonuclease
MPKPETILCPKPAGLYCAPGDFHIDPIRPVERSVITHGHSDHARSGHGTVLATVETLAIMAARYGENFARSTRRKSGIAMRFSRISRIRWDKPAREADELSTLEKMLD